MEYAAVVERLKALSVPENVEGMARFGINPQNTYGVSVPDLRKLAKGIGKDHALAQQLWSSGIHEARILAGMTDDPRQVTPQQMDSWAEEFDSWDVCDQCCMNLFDKTPFAYEKARQWSGRTEEFVKRAGFALMAVLAVHDRGAGDEKFVELLPLLVGASVDERNFVRKAVNWALRQIGKRSLALNREAIRTARQIEALDSKSARWIAADALRELTSDAVQKRVAG